MTNLRLLPAATLAITALGLGMTSTAGQLPIVRAEPTITAEPTYYTGTALAPEATRRDHDDAVKASADFKCDQAQFVEWIYTITGPGGTFTGDIAARVPIFGNACSQQQPCGRLFDGNTHKISGSFSGHDVYTVTATVKIWTASTVFCTGANCYPFGTPLRTFQLPPVQATL